MAGGAHYQALCANVFITRLVYVLFHGTPGCFYVSLERHKLSAIFMEFHNQYTYFGWTYIVVIECSWLGLIIEKFNILL